MPKQLITVIGLAVSLGVVAVAVALVALPMWVQALGVDAQTATVAQTNALYQTQVDTLLVEQERQDEIDASVAALRAEIPATNQLDDVFEVITPEGVFRMTKREFYRDFAGVVASKSYTEGRIYHFPKVPARALRYFGKT